MGCCNGRQEPQSTLNPRSEYRISGCRLLILESDISSLDTDSIVNSTNSNLTLDIGDAKAILDRGGVALRTECIKYVNTHGLVDTAKVAVTTPGELKCRYVIHVAAPMYVTGKRGEPESLHQAVINVLDAAQQLGCRSIALPAIGTVPYDYPKNECAMIMVNACKSYFSKHRGSLSLVRFVSADKYMVRCFKKAFGAVNREDGIIDPLDSFSNI